MEEVFVEQAPNARTMSGAPQMSSGLSKLKKKHFRVKHQKVKLFRANEPLLSVFMWGVNHTVSRRVSAVAGCV